MHLYPLQYYITLNKIANIYTAVPIKITVIPYITLKLNPPNVYIDLIFYGKLTKIQKWQFIGLLISNVTSIFNIQNNCNFFNHKYKVTLSTRNWHPELFLSKQANCLIGSIWGHINTNLFYYNIQVMSIQNFVIF